MANEIAEEGMIRRYLLGQLAEDERQQLEEKMMSDNELYDRVLLAEDEMVEEYVRGGMSKSEREGFEASFLSTVEGRKQVSFEESLSSYVSSATASEGQGTKEAGAEEREGIPGERGRAGRVIRPGWWRRPAIVPYFKLAAAAVIVVALGLGFWRVFIHQSDVKKGLDALAHAYREQRPIEARISGLNYAPQAANTRGIDEEKVDQVSRDRAERILLDAVVEHPSAASHHALGKLYLAGHDFDKAIKQFDEALKSDTNNAQLHNDYGAALLEKGKADREKDSGVSLKAFARSLEYLTKSVELEGSRLDALFNRALCKQYLVLPRQAGEDWRKYLEIDGTSKWADEARRNLKDLEEQKQIERDTGQLLQNFLDAHQSRDDGRAWEVFSRSRMRNRNLIVDSLLDSYLDLDSEGRTDEAERRLRLLVYVGELETDQVGDRYTADLARFYLSTTSAQRKLLVKAQQLRKLTQEYAKESRLEKAIEACTQAKQIFEQLGSCEAKHAEYIVGVCYLRKPDVRKGLSILEAMARTCEAAGYKWLLSKIFYSMADAHDSLMQYSKALDSCNESLALSKQLQDRSGQALCYIQEAILHQTLCDYEKALKCLYRSLNVSAGQILDRAQVWIVYDVAAECFASIGSYSAGLSYQREALRIANDMGIPLNLSRSYSHLGAIYGRLENYEEAIKATRMEFELGEMLSDESTGREIMASAYLRLGHLYRQVGDHSRAISYYDQTLDIYKALNVEAVRYESHKGKVLCYLGLSDVESAEKELQIALNLIERYRSTILEESNRNRFFDNEQEIYDLAIDFFYRQKKDPRFAFDYSEASHARSLLDLNSQTARVTMRSELPDLRLPYVTRPLKLGEIQLALPEQTQLLHYAVLKDKLIIWVVTRTGMESATRQVDIKELEEKVDNYRQLVLQPFADQKESLQLSNDLYELLIQPVESYLDKEKYVCVVPDKILNYVPFGALFSSALGRYLVEDYLVGTCPSATLFVRSTDLAREKPKPKEESLLSVGNPRFDNTDFPSLHDLPSSAREAEAVAKLYKNARVLIGDAAKKERAKAEMAKVEIIHFAMHYVPSESSPMLSKLLFAKGEQSSPESMKSQGWLHAYEIYDMSLPRARLAVLSACQTGIERSYNGEGAVGIARPFIKAGVPLIIASLWPVETNATSRLMIRFHEYRKRSGTGTAAALRRAQLDTLNSPDRQLKNPYYWAPFTLIGGYASF